ncbi:MAG: HDIG domain-containing protein, partial [Thermoleophilaceae bacterium]|nr:HDIG domain-containing protein [Thermoleophilaceae bacterium]
MEQTTMTTNRCYVRDFVDGQDVDQVFVVRGRSVRQKRNGEPFLKLQLGDLSGSVEGVMWDGVGDAEAHCPSGAVVRIAGRFSIDQRYGAGITIRALRAAAEGEYDIVDLTEAPPIPYAQMAADLDELVGTVQQPHLRELLERLLDPRTEVGERWHAAPAAKYYHQAYRHGLLEHCLGVAQAVSAISATFPGIDRDVAVTGALLHDIGKIEAYEQTGGAIDLSDAGKLQGEIPLGYYRVRSQMEAIEGFP